MFKKRVSLVEIIDLYIEEILSCPPTEIKAQELDNKEILNISNQIPVFSLLVFLNFLLKNTPEDMAKLTEDYFVYRLDKKVHLRRENDNLNCTDIENISDQVIISLEQKTQRFAEKKDDEFYIENNMLEDGFILAESFTERVSPHTNLSNEKERLKYGEVFNVFTQVYETNMRILGRYRVRKLKDKEKESMLKQLSK